MNTRRTSSEKVTRVSQRHIVPLVAAAALVTAVLPVSAASPEVPSAEPVARPIDGQPVRVPDDRAAASRTVTLVTGDRVTLHGDDVAIQPGPGRDQVVFDQFRKAGHLFVVPADALGLLNRHRLDWRLFDVTTLLRLGYGDGRRADLPVLVMHRQRAVSTLRATDARLARRLPAIGTTALRTPKTDATGFWRDVVRPRAAGGPTLAAGVGSIWLDGQRRLLIDRSVPQIGAPEAWAAGFTGAGITVAVLDTGIDADHPDFAGRILEVRNFTDAPDGNDTVGHGTHVASILAGSGAASDGRFRGVAPDADLLIGKVCPTQFCPESAILAGMAWASQNGADVVNLSLGSTDTPVIDPLEQAVNDLTAQTGTLFVAAAGNSGPHGRVNSPASADAAVAVGSVDRDGSLARTSSRGPRVGDEAIKPDLTAPGVGIVAARAADGFLGDPVDEHYTRLSGTSMASPHVAGAAVLLGQQHADWDPGRLKAALMGSARPNPELTVFEQGAGRVDVARAIEQSVVTTPASVSLGLQPFPHEDDEVLTRDVTYHNLGSEPVVLDLAVAVTGPDGQPAPARMFDVQPTSLTVPAGGSATATLSADTRVPSTLGLFSGALTATGAGTSVGTPVGVNKENTSYDLTITHLDRNGVAPLSYLTRVAGVDSLEEEEAEFDPDGTVTLRLPAGSYHLYSTILTVSFPSFSNSALAMPLLELDQDTTLVLDARAARPMRVAAPEPTARSAAAAVVYERRAPDGQDLFDVVAGLNFDHIFTAQVGPAVSDAEVITYVYSGWGEPGATGDFTNSPYAYHLVWTQRGSYWTGFDREVDRRELAVIDTEYRAPKPDRFGFVLTGASVAGSGPLAGDNFPVRPPFERTEYYLTRGVTWSTNYQLFDDPFGFALESEYLRPEYELLPGLRLRTLWGSAVYGPAFPRVELRSQWVSRLADVGPMASDAISVSVPLYNDFSIDHQQGFVLEDSGRTALYLDGRLLGEVPIGGSGQFAVPDAAGDYRLEVEGLRTSLAELSTRVSATWRFRSAHDPTTDVTVLPVMAVRFGPLLDEHNGAPAGQRFLLPVWVQRQHGAPPESLRKVDVEVSYDDGASWRRVRVFGAGSLRVAALSHPDHAGFVSLRTRAVDRAGNSVEQTILRAYRLR